MPTWNVLSCYFDITIILAHCNCKKYQSKQMHSVNQLNCKVVSKNLDCSRIHGLIGLYRFFSFFTRLFLTSSIRSSCLSKVFSNLNVSQVCISPHIIPVMLLYSDDGKKRRSADIILTHSKNQCILSILERSLYWIQAVCFTVHSLYISSESFITKSEHLIIVSCLILSFMDWWFRLIHLTS